MNRSKYDAVAIFILLTIAVLSHRNWFFSLEPIAVGDWLYNWPELMEDFIGFPISWMSEFNLGYFNIASSFHYFQLMMGIMSRFGFGYNIIERLLFMWPAALLPGLLMYLFSRRYFEIVGSFIASLVYQLNTFSLLYGGAHLLFLMAYALTPAVFIGLDRVIYEKSVVDSMLAGLTLSLIFIYEIRIGYVVWILSALYCIYTIISLRYENSRKVISLLSVSLIIPLLVLAHFFIPILIYQTKSFGQLPRGLLVPFVRLLNSLSLYHPFFTGGRLGEFIFILPPGYALILPVFAFATLLRSRDSRTLFFSIVALVGIMLLKQNNPPFKEIYELLFHNFPGFIAFRESSKFAVLVSFPYSYLIGKFFCRIQPWYKGILSKITYMISAFLLVFSVSLIAYPAFTNQLGYAYDTTQIPAEYLKINELISDDEFSRVIWFPWYSPFSLRSNHHPIVTPAFVFQNLPLNNKSLAVYLNLLSVKYIVWDNNIMPYRESISSDPYFLYFSTIKNLPSVEIVSGFRNLIVLRNKGALPRFYIIPYNPLTSYPDINLTDVVKATPVAFSRVSPTVYLLHLNISTRSILIFNEAYDDGWILHFHGHEISSVSVFGLINGFILEETGTFNAYITYKPQEYFTMGFIVSILTIFACLLFYIRIKFLKQHFSRDCQLKT
jgi:hypothetical protein